MHDAENLHRIELPLTHATLATTVTELRDQLADEQATHAKTISNFEEFADGAREDRLHAEAATVAYRSALAELTDASRRLVETFDILDKAHGFGHPDLDRGITNVRDAIRRAGDAHLKATGRCNCTCQGIDTPIHDRGGICLTPEQDQANHQRHKDLTTTTSYIAAQVHIAAQVPVASVPRDARESQAQVLSLADVRAARGVVSPEQPFVLASGGVVTGPMPKLILDDCVIKPKLPVDELPVEGSWGPYELERQTRTEPMPAAVRELHDAGLVRSGDPGLVVRNVVLAHLLAAVEAARLDLGAFEHKTLEWLARGEDSTAQVVIGLIRRAYAAGAAGAKADVEAVR